MRVYFVLAVVFFLSRCSLKTDTEALNLVVIKDEKIENILSSFVQQSECLECVFEIYIDKKDPHFYELILHKDESSLTAEENRQQNQKALQKVKVDDVVFDIYSGAEHYFSTEKSFGFNKSEDFSVDSLINHTKGTIWVVTEEYGELKVEKVEHRYPYIPGPRKDLRFPEKIK